MVRQNPSLGVGGLDFHHPSQGGRGRFLTVKECVQAEGRTWTRQEEKRQHSRLPRKAMWDNLVQPASFLR